MDARFGYVLSLSAQVAGLSVFLAISSASGDAQNIFDGHQTEVAQSLLTGTGAVLQGLDKVTATVTVFTAPLDTVVRFGTLDITVRACQKAPPTEPPEKVAFLEIDETNTNVGAARLYSGWMFASSPALAALEHPVYDVWVIDCMNASNTEPDRSD